MSQRTVLRFATGKLGCFAVLAMVAGLFFAAAISFPGIAKETSATHGRMSGLIDLAAMVSGGNRPWGMFVIGIMLLGYAAVYGWRWADGVAVAADGAGLCFHRSLFKGALRWDEISSVEFQPDGRYRGLLIKCRDGTARRIGLVSGEHGAAFADFAMKRVASVATRPAAPATPPAT